MKDFNDIFFRMIPLNRRRQRRFLPMKDTCVSFAPPAEIGRVPVVDISPGGLSFIYAGTSFPARPKGSLDIVVGGTVVMPSLPFETMSDLGVDGCRKDGFWLRRCGVRFKDLGPEELAVLRAHIRGRNF